MKRKLTNFKKAVFRVDRGLDGLQVHHQVEDHQMTSELDMYQLVQQHHPSKAQNHQILVRAKFQVVEIRSIFVKKND